MFLGNSKIPFRINYNGRIFPPFLGLELPSSSSFVTSITVLQFFSLLSQGYITARLLGMYGTEQLWNCTADS